MVLKNVREKVDETWTFTKKVLAAASAWAFVYMIVSMMHLGAAFSYDDTLVDSAPAYEKAVRATRFPGSSQYWEIVNNSYELETPKILPYTLAWTLRGLGFTIRIIADREAIGAEPLKKEWRHLAPKTFYFVGAPSTNAGHAEPKKLPLDGRVLVFFGDSDREIAEAKRDGVYAVRVKRGSHAVGAGAYHPGKLGEFVLPLSHY